MLSEQQDLATLHSLCSVLKNKKVENKPFSASVELIARPSLKVLHKENFIRLLVQIQTFCKMECYGFVISYYGLKGK